MPSIRVDGLASVWMRRLGWAGSSTSADSRSRPGPCAPLTSRSARVTSIRPSAMPKRSPRMKLVRKTAQMCSCGTRSATKTTTSCSIANGSVMKQKTSMKWGHTICSERRKARAPRSRAG